jgi:molybdopterin-guanine dinucleotide biosynthesis protein A
MQTNPNNNKPAYAEPLDAIVLAGTDANPRRMIQGQNKAFLEIGGRTLVRRVVDALLQASSVGRLFVVGPADRLRGVLGDLPEFAGGRVVVVEQAGQMLANAWAAIHASEAHFRERHGRDDPRRPLLFISSDLPLISAAAVDDFLARCALEDERQHDPFSMLTGVAEEASLARFYPATGQPGIRRPYVHFADKKLRLANIYVGRPRTLTHQEFLQTGFDHRKAEKWKNVVALAWRFLGQPGGWQAAWLTLRLQATLLAARGRKGTLYRALRRGNTQARIERGCGNVLGGSVRLVVTPYGGLSLDADNEEDFAVLSRRFEDWRRIGPTEPEPAAPDRQPTAGSVA